MSAVIGTVLLVYLLSLSGLVALGVIFIPVIPEEAADLVTELEVILQQIETDYLSEPISILTYEVSLSPLLPDISAISPEALISPDIILNAVQATSTNVGWLLVILVTTFYLLQDWAQIKRLVVPMGTRGLQ